MITWRTFTIYEANPNRPPRAPHASLSFFSRFTKEPHAFDPVFLSPRALSRPFVIGTNHISDSASSTRLAAPGLGHAYVLRQTRAEGGRRGWGAAAVFTQDVAVALEAVHQVPRLLRVVAHVGDEQVQPRREEDQPEEDEAEPAAGARCEMRVAWWKAGSVRRVCVARTRGRGPTPPRSSGTCPSARRS